MLQRLSQHITACHDRAEECRRRAEAAAVASIKTEFLDLETSWLQLANSYEFVETLERLLLSARNYPNGIAAK